MSPFSTTDGRELDVENCTRLGIVLTRHLLLCSRPSCTRLYSGWLPRLITLDRVRSEKRGEEEVANKHVIGKHLDMLLEIFSAFPHAAPAKSSLRQAFDYAFDKILDFQRSKDDIVAVQANKFKWCSDETDKLHMCWRYGWGCYMRASTSRDYALNRIKSAFEGDRVPPTKSASGSVVVADDTDSGAESVVVASEENEDEEIEESASGSVDGVESASGNVVVADEEVIEEIEAEEIEDSSPKKLRRNISVVSVDESESPPKKLRPGTAPPSAAGPPRLAAAASPRRPQAVDPAPPASPPPKKKHVFSAAVLPPPAHVMMTPPPQPTSLKQRLRKTFATPRSKPQSPELESTTKQKPRRKATASPAKPMKEATPMKAKTRKKAAAMKAKPMKGAKPIQQADVSDIIDKVDLSEQEKNDKLKALLRMTGCKPALRPAMAPCHGECRRAIKQENGKTLIQISQKKKILGQVTLGAFKGRLWEASEVLLWGAGLGYDKAAFQKVKQAMLATTAD